MTTRSKRVKLAFLTAAAAVVLLAGGARKAAAACTNDIDCPDPACGGQVCEWSATGSMDCKAAGGKAAGMDGWCSTDTDCKCMGMGAKCVFPYCTFTKPPGGGTGGASGTGTGGSSGTGSGGSSGTGTGGSSGTDAGTTPPKDSGGCSVAGSTDVGAFGALAGLGLLGLVLASRRRKS